MDIRTLFLIIVWAFVAVMVIGLFLVTFIYGRWTVKDNPKNAVVYNIIGNHRSKGQKGRLLETTKEGLLFATKDKKIIVPASYEVRFHKNRRELYLNEQNQLIASPFITRDKKGNLTKDTDKILAKSERENLLVALLESHIGTDAVRALRGKAQAGLIVVGIIAFIFGALMGVGFLQVQKSMVQQQQATTQQQTPPTTQQPQIEIKPGD